MSAENPMQRYFFDLNDGQVTSDVDGRDLADDEAAARYAMTLAADVARSAEALDAGAAAVLVTVRSATHQTVAQVRLVMELSRY